MSWEQLSLFPDAPENVVLENRPLMSLEEMRKHEWCVSWSGGKDSTATILLMREYGIPIKQITYVRMMWDEITPATLPIMTEFVDESTERLRLWGYSVVIVPSVKTAKSIAEKALEHPRKPSTMIRKGKAGGIAEFLRGSCRFAGVKQDTIRRNTIPDAFRMLGICADEKPRVARMRCDCESILATLGLSQNDAKRICDENHMLSPLYGVGNGRDGCWFCPNASKRERERLRIERPDLYQNILWMIELTARWWNPPFFTSVNGWCFDYIEENGDPNQYKWF